MLISFIEKLIKPLHCSQSVGHMSKNILVMDMVGYSAMYYILNSRWFTWLPLTEQRILRLFIPKVNT